jgi:hypothetical protein
MYLGSTILIDNTLHPPLVPEDYEFKLPLSRLGIYTQAAVSTDTRPCAKIGT